MKIKYRVDRVKIKKVPVGMNSILYYGTSKKEALSVYNNSEIHRNTWNQYDEHYGIILSSWNGSYSDDDVILMSKGI